MSKIKNNISIKFKKIRQYPEVCHTDLQLQIMK